MRLTKEVDGLRKLLEATEEERTMLSTKITAAGREVSFCHPLEERH